MTPNPTPLDEIEEAFTTTEPSAFQRAILYALPRTGKHVYQGTVSREVKAQRRARSKAARKARAQGRRAAR